MGSSCETLASATSSRARSRARRHEQCRDQWMDHAECGERARSGCRRGRSADFDDRRERRDRSRAVVAIASIEGERRYTSAARSRLGRARNRDPAVAAAIAAASLTPSPTIATGPRTRAASTARACVRATCHRSNETNRARARADEVDDARIIARQISMCQPSRASEVSATRASARIGSASPQRRRPCARSRWRSASRRARDVRGPRIELVAPRAVRANPRGCSDEDSPSCDEPGHAVAELLAKLRRERGAFECERTCDGMRATRFDRGGERARIDVAKPGRDREPTSVSVPVLSTYNTPGVASRSSASAP